MNDIQASTRPSQSNYAPTWFRVRSNENEIISSHQYCGGCRDRKRLFASMLVRVTVFIYFIENHHYYVI
jgi:hypothetical protein